MSTTRPTAGETPGDTALAATERRRVGVIGLGAMGGAVAARLAASGHTVSGYDTDPARRDTAAAAGVTSLAVGDAAALGGLDVVVSSLPDDVAVRSALLDSGLVARVRDGATIVETSTILPQTARELAAAAAVHGVGVVDGAISGSPAEARQGRIVVLAAGDAEHVRVAASLLGCLGDFRVVDGDVGDCKTLKLVNNMMALGNIAVAAEAFTVGVKAGLAPQLLFEHLSVSGGRSHHFTKRFPAALEGHYEPGWTVSLGHKDMGLGLALAQDAGAPAYVGALVHQVLGAARRGGLGDDDVVALLKLYGRWAQFDDPTATSAVHNPTAPTDGDRDGDGPTRRSTDRGADRR